MHARVGGALRADLLLMAELDGFSGSRPTTPYETSSSLIALNVVAQWYPSASQGYFVSSGLGGGSVTSSGSPLFANAESPIGPAYKIGTGYDIKVNRALAVTPFASFVYVVGGTRRGKTEKVSGSVFLIGIEANIITRQLID